MSDGTASPGMESLAYIRPALRSLILAHTFLTLLAPLIFALLHYSTPRSRRQPIFILNAIAIAMAFSNGVIADTSGIHGILSPQEALPPMLYIWSGILGIFETMLVDLILLIRLVAVYPLSRVGLGRFVLITCLPILLKIVRGINVTVFLKVLSDLVKTSGMNAIPAYFALPYLKIEWAAQVVDNTYASAMFLWAIRSQSTGSECPSNCSSTVQPTLGHRLRFLFRIALSNFVIPTLFSIVQLAISFSNVSWDYVGDVIYVNNMVSVYGVVFASVWAGKESLRSWKETTQARRYSSSESGNRKRRAGDTLGIGTWNVETGPTSFSIADTAGGCQSDGLDGSDGNKQGFSGVDLEVGHDMAVFPLAKG